MMSLFESAWVIARRDFTATVFSRSFILFLLAPLLVVIVSFTVGEMAGEADRSAARPVVALAADSATVAAVTEARQRLVAGTSESSFPVLRAVDPAENAELQAQALLADEEAGYSAVLSGTLDRPVLTGPERIGDGIGRRLQLLLDDARAAEALRAAGAAPPPAQLERVVTDQAAGNLQLIRRGIARVGQGIIFTITVLLATLLLSNLAEEKTNKVIEVLAASVPLDAVFLGKLMAMLGVSLVGLMLWGGMLATGYLFLQVLQDWMTLPQAGPAVGWAAFIALLLIYYASNYLLLGALFLGIGAQASNIREIQTLSMPVTMLQVIVFFIAMSVVGSSGGALTWFAYIFPFSSPLSMVAHASESSALWPHLVALAWQALWIVIIIRLASRFFRMTVLKSAAAGGFWDFLKVRRAPGRAAPTARS